MKRPQETDYNPWFSRYIKLVPEGSYLDLLYNNTRETLIFFENIPAEKHEYRYAEGKWTPKQILQHIIDTERVMLYRALVAARADTKTVLCNMEEDEDAASADVSHLSMADLIAEFKAVRASSEKFYEHLPEKAETTKANAGEFPITAAAVGYIIIGHIMHHIGTLKERYLK
jgi:hypothetical protein